MPAPIALPSFDELHELLEVYPKVGALVWKARALEQFATERDMNAFNARYAGKPAFTCVVARGRKKDIFYRQGRIHSAAFYAHRVIYKMVKGVDPAEGVDHIDHNGLNNRISNLRPADDYINSRNRRISSLNKSGMTGVYLNPHGRWVVRIENEHLGTFDNYAEACAARGWEEIVRGYHPNHGAA